MTVAVLDIDRLSRSQRTPQPSAWRPIAGGFAQTHRQTSARAICWCAGAAKRFADAANTSLEHARIALERFRKHGFGLRPDGQPVTWSIGGPSGEADALASWTALVEKAEARAAARVKQEGRDGVRGR